MENRSYALLAGTFTLLLLAGVILVAMFLNRSGAAPTFYEIVSTTAVNGLSEQSPVRYQGVAVGKVQFLSLDPDAPGRVHIRIGVASGTPITEATWAELAMQGITGLASIDLHDDGSSKARLKTEGDVPPVIPLRPGLFDRFSQGGSNVLENLEKISSRLAMLLNDQNMKSVQDTIRNAAAASASIQDIGEQLRPLASKLGALVDNLKDASLQVQGAARDVSVLARQSRIAIAHLDAPGGPLAMATRSLREISYAAARLASDTLPAVSGMANEINAAAHDVASTARRVGDMPQSVIFGMAPPRPGPGEDGFPGFRRGR
ncbi:MAG TPA: MlaD family protein [Bordetella sp.]|nr:MlaD family protein [Bordetella sp.]